MDVIASARWAREQGSPWSDGPATDPSADHEQPGAFTAEIIADLRDALDRLDGTRWSHEFDGLTLRLRRGWQGLRLVIWIPLALWLGSAIAGGLASLLQHLSASPAWDLVLMLGGLAVIVESLRRAIRYGSPTEIVISKRTGQARRGAGGGGRAWTVPLAAVDHVRYVEPDPGVGRLELGKGRVLLEVRNRDRLGQLEELGEYLAEWLDKDFLGSDAPPAAHPYRR
jgi:hypothetical protein